MSERQPIDDGATSNDAPVAPSPPAVEAPTRKEPPPEKPSDIRRRSYIILSFWLIVLFLGLPIWWKTTTIYRANLPINEMLEWADGKVGQMDRGRFATACLTRCLLLGMPSRIPPAHLDTSRYPPRPRGPEPPAIDPTRSRRS